MMHVAVLVCRTVFVMFEHAAKNGTREPFGLGMKLAASALTMDGSKNPAKDTLR